MELRPPTEPALPPIEPTCEACVFAHQIDVEDDGRSVFYCRRFPPVPVAHDLLGGLATAWPTVRPEDWCGEFVPRADE